MSQRSQVSLLSMILILALSGCSVLISPQPQTTDLNAAEPTAQVAPALTSTAAPAPPPTGTAPNQTDVPTGQSAQVITPENAANLVPNSLGIPNRPRSLLFPSSAAALPETLEARPGVLLLDETSLQPVLLDPPGLGNPIPIPLGGGDIIATAPDASSLLVRADSKTSLYTFNGKQIEMIDQPAQIYGASYSADSRYLAVASDGQWQVTLYDLEIGSTTVLSGFETAAPVYAGLAIPGGKNIAWLSRNILQFQDVASGKMGAQFSFMDFIGPVAFSPDGTRAALYTGGQLGIYQVPSAQKVVEIGSSGFISSLSYSSDGRLLAAGRDDTLQIFDAGNLASVAAFPAGARVDQVAFSPDGRYIVTTQEDNQLTIWRTPSE
jgi:hypothetical protein